MDNSINVVFCVDANYIYPTLTCINSLLKNNEHEHIVFHVVLENGFPSDGREQLVDKIKGAGGKLYLYEFYNRLVKDLPVNRPGQPVHITLSAYYRLFLSEILPNNLDKVLYLDADIIINGSIRELWETNISNYAVGVVPDMDEANLNIYRRLQYSPKCGYFNSGVLLINLKYWREHDLQNSYLKFWREYPNRVVYHDQDILNYVLREKKLLLPLKYNVQTPALFKGVNISWEYDDQLQDALRNPIIVHYTTPEKPWIKGCKHPWRNLFFKYAQLPIPKFLTKKKQSKQPLFRKIRNLLIRFGILETNQMYRTDLPTM